MRRRKWVWLFAVVLALILGWGGLNWWNEQVPVRIKQIAWTIPKSGGELKQGSFDLDNDGNEEVIVWSEEHVWWLRIEGDMWLAEKMPLKSAEIYNPWESEKLKVALITLRNGQLWLLRKRGKWVWQRLVENVRYAVVTDLDNDGREDDLVVLKLHPKCQVLWFKVDADGIAHLLDTISLPKPAHNNIWLSDELLGQAVEVVNIDYTIWVEGKDLKNDKGLWTCSREDLDGDGRADFVRTSRDWRKPLTVVANLSSQGKEVSTTLKKFSGIDTPFFGDLDGNGWKELLFMFDLRGFLIRLWIEGQQWRWEQYRLGKEYWVSGTMRVGNRDWLLVWNKEKGRLIALWRERDGWKRKTWQFHMTPWSTLHDPRIERDDRNWILVMTRIWSPERHPFWRRWLPIAERVRQSKVPIPPFLIPLPMEERFRQVWRWDERKLSWKLEQPIHEDDLMLRKSGFRYGSVTPIDLDKDGQEEKLVYEDHVGGWGNLAVKLGRFWKRWQIYPLWDGQHFPFAILNQKEKSWVVALDCVTYVDGKTKRILRAWTLERNLPLSLQRKMKH